VSELKMDTSKKVVGDSSPDDGAPRTVVVERIISGAAEVKVPSLVLAN
jgi:hypothetical protein